MFRRCDFTKCRHSQTMKRKKPTVKHLHRNEQLMLWNHLCWFHFPILVKRTPIRSRMLVDSGSRNTVEVNEDISTVTTTYIRICVLAHTSDERYLFGICGFRLDFYICKMYTETVKRMLHVRKNHKKWLAVILHCFCKMNEGFLSFFQYFISYLNF